MTPANGTIWYTRCPVGNATEIALSQGWLRDTYRKLGYDFASISTSDDPAVWRTHFNHQHPALFRDGGNIPPIWTRSKGEYTKVIGLNFLAAAQAIVVRPDSGIREIADLKGKRLGVPERPHESIDFWRATTLRAYEVALGLAGLDLSEVQLVPLRNDRPYIAPATENASLFGPGPGRDFQRTESAALAADTVDAVFLNGGRVTAAERAGSGRAVIDLEKRVGLLDRTNIDHPNVITVSGRLADEHPELVLAYLKVLLKTARWARHNRRAVLDLFAEATFVGPDDFETSWAGDFYWTLEPHLSPEGRRALEIEKDFLLRHGFIERDFDISEWIDSSYLEQAKEELKDELAA